MKKKFNFFLNVLLVLLFIMLLGISSTCYASTNVTKEYLEWSFNYLMYSGDLNTNEYYDKFLGWYNNTKSNEFFQDILTNLSAFQKDNNIEPLSNENLSIYITQIDSSTLWFYLVFHNGSIPNNVDNLAYIRFVQNRYMYSYSPENNPEDKLYYMQLLFKGSNYYTISANSPIKAGNSFGNVRLGYNAQINEDLSVLKLKNITFAGLPAGYTNYPFTSSTSTLYPVLLTMYDGNYHKSSLPDNPGEGDGDNNNSGDSGNTGGDTGETIPPNVDLSEIEGKLDDVNTNLENIKDKIPTSGDIENAVEQGNKDYWGDVNEDDTNGELGNIIDDVQNSMQDSLTENEIFGTLEKAEEGFLNLIGGEADDFKISWNDVKYMDKILIPEGQINFSQLCRENETLGTVKSYINIIMSALLSFAIIKYIYNLVLSTLGIDNQYLYDNSPEVTATSTEQIGNVRVTKHYKLKK